MGPGLHFPHPFGIVMGTGVTLGSNVMLYHNVTLGTSRAPKVVDDETIYFVPTVGDDVVVHANTVIAGGVTIGNGATIGAFSLVDRDVQLALPSSPQTLDVARSSTCEPAYCWSARARLTADPIHHAQETRFCRGPLQWARGLAVSGDGDALGAVAV